jgi:cephalosporin-C deacetylase
MAQIDLPLEELRSYRRSAVPPPDLEEFWQQTLTEAAAQALAPTFERVESGLVTVETYDVAFSGFGGDRVRAWLHLPAAAVRGSGRLAGVVQFQGYNGGRGLCHDYTFWAAAGYAHLVVDTRGQGSGWAVGDTADRVGAGPSQPGFLTRGVQDPLDYFYRRVYTDAVRAVETLRSHPDVDPGRVCVTGGSQGGGISLAVAALTRDVTAVMPDVPFLCDFARAVQVALTDPYTELVRFLKSHRDQVSAVFDTLAYFDAAVLAELATAPALFSVALMDQTCPPSTVFAAYNAYGGPKEITVYEYNDHEGGEGFQRGRQLEWLAATVADPGSAPGGD